MSKKSGVELKRRQAVLKNGVKQKNFSICGVIFIIIWVFQKKREINERKEKRKRKYWGV